MLRRDALKFGLLLTGCGDNMHSGQGSFSGLAQALPEPAVLMAHGASIGPFSTTEHFSSTTGPNVQNSRTFVLDWDITDWTAGQDPVGFNDASSGWFINQAQATAAIIHRGTGGSFYVFGSDLYYGRHRLVWRYTAAGALRYSFDGSAAAQLSAAPAYTTALGTARFAIGKNVGESTRACTATNVHFFAVIDADCTDQEMLDLSGGMHGAQRNIVPNFVTQHASLHTLFRGLDWAGGTANWVASAGSSIYTLTRQGTGSLPKNAVSVYQRHDLTGRALDNILISTEASPELHNTTSAMSHWDFAATSSTCLVEVVETQGSSFANQIDVGGKVDGATVQTQRNHPGSGIECFPLNRRLIREFPEQTAAAHNWSVYSGLQSKGGSGILIGIFPQAVWLPAGVVPAFTAYARPSKRVLVWADSIYGQLSDTSSLIHCGLDQAWTGLLRADLAATSWRLTANCWGSRMFQQDIASSAGRTAVVAKQISGLDGTTKNVHVCNLGHNDKELGGYTSKATLISDLTAWRTLLGSEVTSAGIPGFVNQWITPYWGSNDGTKNGGGAGIDMTDVRDAISQVAAAFSDPVADGLTFCTATTGFGDGVHPRVGNPGHAQIYTAMRALACFA